MKHLLINNLVIYLLLLVIFSSCEDDYIKMEIVNKSRSTIAVKFPDFEYDSLYPDTSISQYRLHFSLLPKKKVYYQLPSDLQIFFDLLPSDTFSFFIFSQDIVDTYPWEEIRSRYMVLKRYDLSQEDLHRLNFRITYPPDQRMRDVKMYPAYEDD